MKSIISLENLTRFKEKLDILFNNETTRAIAAETAVQAAIDSEKARAETAESNLSNSKQDKLTPGDNITIENNVISAINNVTKAYVDTGDANTLTTARNQAIVIMEEEALSRISADNNLSDRITEEQERAIEAESLKFNISSFGGVKNVKFVTTAPSSYETNVLYLIEEAL